MSSGYYGFRPYVPVAQRQRNAQRQIAKLLRKATPLPVRIEGRTIAHSFWGKAWCDNLESYMDYENRLPRGRTYVRNGSVVHLEIQPGEIRAMVSGSELYRIQIKIVPVAVVHWQRLCRECSGGIGSLVELLQGRLSKSVMGVITQRETGLFPSPREIDMDCSCPDSAGMCKHIAAVLYGVGARLDQSPELLFALRSVSHEDLITQATDASALSRQDGAGETELADSDLGSVFGIELDSGTVPSVGEAKAGQMPSAAPKVRGARKSSKKQKG